MQKFLTSRAIRMYVLGSPKPDVVGSSPTAPVKKKPVISIVTGFLIFIFSSIGSKMFKFCSRILLKVINDS